MRFWAMFLQGEFDLSWWLFCVSHKTGIHCLWKVGVDFIGCVCF